MPTDRKLFARYVIANIATRMNLTAREQILLNILKLAEEVGEVSDAVCKTIGLSRKTGEGGTVRVGEELADVIITAYVTAESLGIDVDDCIEQKMQGVIDRGGI